MSLVGVFGEMQQERGHSRTLSDLDVSQNLKLEEIKQMT